MKNIIIYSILCLLLIGNICYAESPNENVWDTYCTVNIQDSLDDDINQLIQNQELFGGTTPTEEVDTIELEIRDQFEQVASKEEMNRLCRLAKLIVLISAL